LTTTATAVVSRIPYSRAPRTRRASIHPVSKKPTTNTATGRVWSFPRVRAVASPLATNPPFTNPMMAMNSPIPTPMARLRDRGMASITASRKRVRTNSRITSPSRRITDMAWGQVSLRAPTSWKVTTAFSPIPGARAKG
jgi:hypothetical protein